MGEAERGEAYDLAAGRLVADHVQVVLQGRVLGTLKVHQLRLLVDPDLQAMGTSVTSVPRSHFLLPVPRPAAALWHIRLGVEHEGQAPAGPTMHPAGRKHAQPKALGSIPSTT